MKKIVVGLIIAVIAIITLVIVWGTGYGITPYYETETAFGMWQQTIFIEFADGTNKSLKLIEEGRDLPFTVKYQGAVVRRIGMELSASVSGAGYDGATLRYDQSFGVIKTIKASGVSIVYSKTTTLADGTTKNIPMGTTAPILTTRITVSNDEGTGALDDVSSGLYSVRFTPQGRVQYKGYPDGGNYQTIALPSPRAVTVTVVNIPPASIVVTLSSDVISD